jgi:hypothetical protein
MYGKKQQWAALPAVVAIGNGIVVLFGGLFKGGLADVSMQAIKLQHAITRTQEEITLLVRKPPHATKAIPSSITIVTTTPQKQQIPALDEHKNLNRRVWRVIRSRRMQRQ